MHLLVLAARVPRRHWSDSDFLADLLRALAVRGHHVELVADCIEEPAMFDAPGAAGSLKLRALHPYENVAPRSPRALAATLRRRVDHGGYDAVLSTTALAPCGVWMPIEPNAMSWLNHAAQALPPHSLALTLLRHHVAFGGAIAERAILRRARQGTGPRDVRTVVAMGARAADRLRAGLPPLASCVIDVGYAARSRPGADAALLRAHTRAALNIPAGRPVVLVAQLAAARWIRPLLTALGELHRADNAACPVLLVAARDTFALHDLAARRGALEPLRLLGTTTRLDAAIAAADALAVPMTRGSSLSGAEGSGWCSRVVADALAWSRPVLAAADAPGAELIEATGAGITVREPTAAGWRAALELVTQARFMAEFPAKAAAAGATLDFEAFVGRFEGVLGEAVALSAPTLLPA